MNICVITALYKPYSKGGAEQVVKNIVDGLEAEGHEVVVITTRPSIIRRKIPFNPPLKKGEINVIRFYPWNLFWFGGIDKKQVWLRLPWHILDVFNFYSYFKIRHILKKEHPNVVMTHNLKGMGYTVPLAIRHSGIKHIHALHDVQLAEPSGLLYPQKIQKSANQQSNILRNFLIKPYSWINKKLFGSPDMVISPSQWLLDFYVDKGFFKMSRKIVIKNPTPLNPPLLKGEEKIISLPHKEMSGVIKILNLLYIGQIEGHKGIIFFIDALKKLSPIIKINLDIVGNGSKLETIKKLAQGSDNIKFHGYVENNLLNKFFIQSDFLIIPSLCYENAPTVIYESFLNGVPVIASDIGGICELVKEGYNGYIFEAGNSADLRKTLERCLKDVGQWYILRQNALNSVKGQGIENYLDNLMGEILSTQEKKEYAGKFYKKE